MIPIASPLIPKNATKYLLRCLKSGWISSKGPFADRFEQKFAEFVGAKYGVATNSGTSALHLALAAIDIGPGDEVIIPALTMIATALPVLYLGATPVLVDSEAETGNIDVGQIEEKITKRTRAIIPVHLHGHPAAMAEILELAKKYRLQVIEDAAEAHGAKILLNSGWRTVGSIGEIGCFSFYANKIITTGEGGMAVTDSGKLAERMCSLRNFSRTSGQHFLHTEIGFSYRMSSLQAAFGVAQLELARKFVAKKRAIAKRYRRLLSSVSVSSVTLPIEKADAKSVFWQYGILLLNQSIRDRVASFLKKHGVETRPFFIPLHQQPGLIKRGFFRGERYPVAEELSQRGLCLPSGLTITESQISFVCHTLQNELA